jgi:TRAP-type C4-dicarboxylate transport system permease small subunit
MMDLSGFAPKTLTFSSSLLFLLIGVSVWLRIEYLKHFNFFVYKTRRIPMWFSAAAAFGAGVLILI